MANITDSKPMVVINKESGLAESIPEADAYKSLEQGTHAVALNDPEGNPISVPMEEAGSLLQEGYTQPSSDQIQNLLKYAKHASGPEQFKAGLEEAARSATFGLSTGVERAFGAKPEDIRAREEVFAQESPVAKTLSGVGGLAASALVGGEGKILAKAGQAASDALGLGKAGAGFVNQITGHTIRGAFETALFQGGTELHKKFVEDPDQTAESALQHMGMAALLGAGVGIPLGVASEGLMKLRSSLVGSLETKAPSFVSEVDMPGVKSGDFTATVRNSNILSDQEKQGILSGLTKKKAVAPELEEIGKKYGLPIKEGHVSDSNLVQQAESNLIHSNVPTFSGMKRAEEYKQAYDGAFLIVDQASQAASPHTKAELGNILKDTITKDLEAQVAPISNLYNEIKQYHSVIPLSEKSAPAIARNIKQLQEFRLSPSSPEGALAKRVIGEIENLKTVDDVKAYRSILNRSVSPTASSGEKRMVGVLSDKLKDLEENSIIRFAKQNMKTPEAKQKVLGIIAQRDAANAQYKVLMDKVGTLSEQLGKGKVYGPQDAINFIKDRLTPEEVTQKLFSKKDSEFLNFFAKEFPEQMALMKDYQRTAIREAAFNKEGALVPNNLFKAVDKMEPEIKKHLYSQAELDALSDMKLYMNNFPKNFNPSGTAHTSAVNAFFEGPFKAGLSNVRASAMERFIKLTGHDAGVKVATNLAAATIKADKAITNASKYLFEPASKVIASAAVSSSDLDKLDKRVKEKAARPEDLIEAGSHAGIPHEYSMAFGRVAANAVNYLSSSRPQNQKAGMLDNMIAPSKTQEAQYRNTLKIAANPLSVFEKIKDSTLTLQDMKDLATLWPGLYRGYKEKVTHQLMKHVADGKTIPYQTRLGLSIFLGQDLDSTMTPQAVMAAQPKVQMQGPGAPTQGQRQSHNMKELQKMGPANMTPGQNRDLARASRPIK